MNKALCLALLLGWLILAPQIVETADASAAATASNAVTNSVGSGSFMLTAVAASTDTNTGTSLALAYSSNRAYFFLKNFGTETLNGFDITQSNANSTLRYCVGQAFKTSSTTQCQDNSTAILVGTAASLTGNLFTTALSAGSSYAFCSSRTGGSGANTVGVSVRSSNTTASVTNS